MKNKYIYTYYHAHDTGRLHRKYLDTFFTEWHETQGGTLLLYTCLIILEIKTYTEWTKTFGYSVTLCTSF